MTSKKTTSNHQTNPNEHILNKKGRPHQSNKNHPEQNNISDKESIGRPKPIEK